VRWGDGCLRFKTANRRKAVNQLARAYLRVANVRQDALHKATTLLAKTKSEIVLEDLNVSGTQRLRFWAGLLKNHTLARAISDVGFGQFRRQLAYKTKWYGGQVIVADRFYPSSRMCSGCGNVKQKLSLSERAFKCEICGFECDRDLNAALNLAQLAGSSPDTLNACGERVSPDLHQATLVEAGTELQSAWCKFA
jgi:putative transposase